jgi:two-component system nitrogen regulation response regulator GlnG
VQSLRKQIDSVAPSDAPVLLLGESGTGKELVARAIHRRSPRREAALVAINMAAIPTELASAELFGARRGAYTGADRDKAGYFMQAEGGTLFMDEIGAASPSVQTQLLRVLETGEIQPAGGGIRAVLLRVISATDANLDDAEQGFSKALRHRLGGLELRLPPLRERRDDIGRLVVHFLQHYFTEAGAGDQLQKSFEDPPVVARWSVLLAAMAAYPWPGNVRELRNFCRQVVLFSEGTGTLLIPDNALESLAPPASDGREQPSEPAGDGGTYRKASRLSDDEVCEAMKSVSFEISRAARELNVARPSLYKRIESVPGLRLTSDLSIAELEEAFRESGGEPELGAQLLQVSRSALQRRWRALELL